jgi:archaeal flagellin FlaB
MAAGNSTGMMGIGALILLIALILVAAIAAAVIVSTGGGMQSKALTTGSQAREGVTPGIDVIQIVGSDPSPRGTQNSITRLTITGRLPPGGEVLSFNTTVINIDTMEFSQTLVYGGVIDMEELASGTAEYAITYVQSGPQNVQHYLTQGDLVRIKINLAGRIGENHKGRITIMPIKAAMSQIEYVAPDTLTNPVEVLWPIS